MGRARHVSLLQDAFEQARDGRPVAVYIQGESGMGKTALVARFLDLVYAESDALILSGRCYEHESVPYKGVDQVVEALSKFLEQLPAKAALELVPHHAPHLARLFPAFAWLDKLPSPGFPRAETPNPREGRRRAFAALRQLLTRVAEIEPIVIALDDMQWADIDTAALIAELMRGPETPRLLLLLAYRTGDRTKSEPLKMLLGESSPIALEHAVFSRETRPVEVRLVEVNALGGEDASSLARSLLGSQGPAAASQAAMIANESSGNPLFVRELARHANERGSLGTTSLEEVVSDRVQRLPGEARRLLEMISVAGSPVGQPIAQAAAGIDPLDEGTLAVLLGEHLVRTRGRSGASTIEPAHDRIREATVTAMTPERVEHSHRALAAAFEAAGGARAETMAMHLRGAGDQVSASRYASAAATDAAAVLAFDRAAELHKLFLDMAPEDDPRRQELEIKLGDALANAGRGAAAAESFLAAASRAGTTPDQAHELRRRAAAELMRSGHIDEGRDVMTEVLASIGVFLPEGTTRKLIRFLFGRLRLRLRGMKFVERPADEIPHAELARVDTLHAAVGGIGMVDPIGAMLLHAHHLRHALATGEPHRIARAIAYEFGTVSFAGVGARKRVEKLIAIARALSGHVGNSPYAEAHVEFAEGMAAHNIGAWRDSRDHCARALELLRQCSAVSWETATAQYYLLWSLFQLGEVKEHAGLAPMWLHEARERDDLYSEVAMRVTLGYTHLIYDDPEAARREIDRANERWSHKGFHVPHLWGWLLHCLTDLYLGDGATAWQRLQELWPTYAKSLFPRLQQPHLQVMTVRGFCALSAAARTSDDTEFTHLLSEVERCAKAIARAKAPWAAPIAPALRASAEALRGRTDSAKLLLDSAVSGLEASDMPIYAAANRRRLGQLLGGDAGKSIVDTADAEMRERGVRNPACLADAFAPGFFRS